MTISNENLSSFSRQILSAFILPDHTDQVKCVSEAYMQDSTNYQVVANKSNEQTTSKQICSFNVNVYFTTYCLYAVKTLLPSDTNKNHEIALNFVP